MRLEGWGGLVLRDALLRSAPQHEADLRKQNRRQPLAAVQRGFVGRTPGLEELHQLLAGAVLVPFAVALDDGEQMIGRLGAFCRRR